MNPVHRAFTLPPPLQRRIEAIARDFMHPDSGFKADFTKPEGEPALLAPDSVAWQVFKNPLSLFIGGIAAVILELAEPRVRTGIWEHTTFRSDPLSRLQHTGSATMMTVYGPRTQAEAMIAAVAKRHDRIAGVTPSGQAYRASDPELLAWVAITAGFGILEAYNAYVRELGETERNSFYADGLSSTRLYGATEGPASQGEIDALFMAMHGKLEPSPIVFEFLDIMLHRPLLPFPFTAMQGLLVKAAVEILPAWIRQRLELTRRWDLRPWQRQIVRLSAAATDRLMLRSGPAVQSCRRLGLPDDYLYTRHSRMPAGQ